MREFRCRFTGSFWVNVSAGTMKQAALLFAHQCNKSGWVEVTFADTNPINHKDVIRFEVSIKVEYECNYSTYGSQNGNIPIEVVG